MKKMMMAIAAILMILSLLAGTALACEEGYSLTGNYYGGGYSNREGIVFAVTGKSYIRCYADPDAGSVGSLPEHASATYLGDTQYDYRGVAWYRVSYQGTTGWISSRYTFLSILVNDSAYYGYRLRASGKSFIRTAPSTDARDLTTIQKGATCSYLGKRTSDMNGRVWYYVTYNGATGWVSSRYVGF